MVDPFRVQNPNRRFWSFIGTGVAGNSRIDRLYIDSTRMHKVHNFSYIQTPFKGHRILSFTVKGNVEIGRGYYKMNTSILGDAQYQGIVRETLEELQELDIECPREKWEVFILTIRSKSISY